MPEFVQAEDGWIDYAPDNVNTVMHAQPDDSIHEMKFGVVDESQEQETRVQSAKKKKWNFKIPTQIHTMANKVKNLFYRESQYGSRFNVNQSNQTQQPGTMHSTNMRNTTAANTQDQSLFQHYNDNDYERQLHAEVDRLRDMLDADFKNQRIIDLENKIRNNKRIIVNTMTDNIFHLRFGFAENKE